MSVPGSNQNMISSSSAVPQRSLGRHFLVLGVSLAVLGVVAYVVQILSKRLMAPWYMPALAVLGVVLVIISLLKQRTLWRVVALSALVLLAGAELALFHALRL